MQAGEGKESRGTEKKNWQEKEGGKEAGREEEGDVENERKRERGRRRRERERERGRGRKEGGKRGQAEEFATHSTKRADEPCSLTKLR